AALAGGRELTRAADFACGSVTGAGGRQLQLSRSPGTILYQSVRSRSTRSHRRSDPRKQPPSSESPSPQMRSVPRRSEPGDLLLAVAKKPAAGARNPACDLYVHDGCDLVRTNIVVGCTCR